MNQTEETMEKIETAKPIKPVKKGRYRNPVEMARALSESEESADRSVKPMVQRNIIDHLIAQRSRFGHSQTDIAKKMGCTQSRVSKLENGKDDDLRLGEFHAYAAALGLDMTILLMAEKPKLVDEIRGHALAIRRLLKRLSTLAGDDPSINKEALRFLRKVTLDFAEMILSTATELKAIPSQATQSPSPRIRVEDGSDDDDPQPIRLAGAFGPPEHRGSLVRV